MAEMSWTVNVRITGGSSLTVSVEKPPIEATDPTDEATARILIVRDAT